MRADEIRSVAGEMAIIRQLTHVPVFVIPHRIGCMVDLPVQIIRFVEEHQPPIVEARFRDSTGCLHTFKDKSPIFTDDWGLYPTTNYSQPGVIRCEVFGRSHSPDGQEVVRVGTELESTENLAEFVVLLPRSPNSMEKSHFPVDWNQFNTT